MYATIEQARAAGAVGTDAQVTAALADARTRIDRYTGQWWEDTAAAVVARVGADGVAFLPFRILEVTEVQVVARAGVDAPVLPASGYLVTSSSTHGQIDSVRFGAGVAGWADPLIAGAEPWSGGFANLYASLSLEQVLVTGRFGVTPTPAEVTAAAAALAARSTGNPLMQLVTAGGGPATPPDTDDEGNAVSITMQPTVQADAIERTRTTGDAAVDALLSPYVVAALRIG